MPIIKMGVRKFRAYLKYMKRALLEKFMIEIDGEQEEELTEALEEAIREIYLRDGTIIAEDVALDLANDVSMTSATFSLSARARPRRETPRTRRPCNTQRPRRPTSATPSEAWRATGSKGATRAPES